MNEDKYQAQIDAIVREINLDNATDESIKMRIAQAFWQGYGSAVEEIREFTNARIQK